MWYLSHIRADELAEALTELKSRRLSAKAGKMSAKAEDSHCSNLPAILSEREIVWPANINWQGAEPQPDPFPGSEFIFELYWTGTEFVGVNARCGQ